jgi:copper resistance protein D
LDLMALTRALHEGAVVVIAGAFAFRWLIAPGLHEADWPVAARVELARWRRICVLWGIALAFTSWAVWLALIAAEMSGQPLAESVRVGVLSTVLARTSFGHVWVLRCGLLVLLALAQLWSARRAADTRKPEIAGAVIALVLLVTLAWTGHAAGTPKATRPLHLTGDALHLLGAGLWLGTLVPLLLVLGRAKSDGTPAWMSVAAAATRRFSRLGLVAVLLLLATGVINAWLLVGSLPALLASPYGQWVMVKIALFAAIVVVAAVNRLWLSPRMQSDRGQGGHSALRRLRRNVIVELALGATIVGVAGLLGTLPPASHHHGPGMDAMDMSGPQ